jgi:type II secretory pathway pseudopilin PulG
MKVKKALTLLEIMIVIFLITLITGAIGYSMKGTLEKGKAFRTEQGMEQLHDLLLMCLAEGDKGPDIVANPAARLKHYALAKNPEKIILDGWGNPYKIEFKRQRNDFEISSASLNAYLEAKNGAR